ncbi:MAG: multicopper oxidase family protein [Polyangiaceae bacterium]|nr:multicopper oxidase family protein [Polyangiaceae bacterium]
MPSSAFDTSQDVLPLAAKAQKLRTLSGRNWCNQYISTRSSEAQNGPNIMHPTFPSWAQCVWAAAIVLACSSPAPTNSIPHQPTGWSDELRMAEAIDEDPDPNVFETHLSAGITELEVIPGTKTPVWAYNGSLPGPLIHVKRGDKLRIHFQNLLPEPTTLHWHGIRLPNNMDGVPDTTQPAVLPGETFDYEFTAPDPGLYWYHPHANAAVQVGNGLYGAVLVDDPDEPKELGDELPLVVSDMALNPDGSVLPPDSGGDTGALFGREGDTLLVNGKVNPILRPRAGLRQRWRIVNTAKSRYFQIAVAGQHFTRIGGDGGKTSDPEELSAILVAPAERVDVLLTLEAEPKASLPVRWVPFDRGFGTAFNRPEALMFTMAVADMPGLPAPKLPAFHRDIEPLDISLATPIQMELTENDIGAQFALGINGVPSWKAEPILAKIGETQVWTVRNTIQFAHPFHLHGFFFQILDLNGVPPRVREWKDTAHVPVDGTLRLAVRFDERPGMWMFHCHILEHAEAGMMGMVHLHE